MQKKKFRIKSILVIVVLIAFLSSFLLVDFTNAEAVKPDKKNILVVASSNNFPPINILDDNHELNGFGRDLSEAVLKAIDAEPVRKHSSQWSTVIEWLASGKADFIHDTGYTKDREAYLDFTLPIIEMPEVIFVKSEQVNINSLASLKGKTVACVDKHITHLYLKQFPEIHCHIVKTPVEGLFTLITGNADAFVYPKQIIEYLAQELNLTYKMKIVGEPLRVLTWSMTVKKGNHALLSRLNKGIKIVKSSGEYERIYKKWFGYRLLSGYSNFEVSIIFTTVIIFSILLSAITVFIFLNKKIRRSRNKLRSLNKHNKLLLESAGKGIYGIDSKGYCTFVNQAATNLFGYSQEELINKFIHEVTHHCYVDGTFYCSDACPVCNSIRNIDAITISNEVFWRKDGTSFPVEYTVAPIWEGKNHLGSIVIFSDITERKQMEDQLRESEEKYRLAMDASRDGLWDWNVTTGTVQYNSSWHAILDEKDIQDDYNSWESRIFPADKSPILNSLRSHLNGENSSWFEEYRLLKADGTYIWVLGRGKVVDRDSQGLPLRMVGTMTDISRQKQAEEELVQHRDHLEELVKEQITDLTTAKRNEEVSRQMLQLVLDSIPVRVFWKDKELNYLGCNKLFAEDAGYLDSKALIGKTDLEMAWRDHAEFYQVDDQLVMESNKEKVAYEEQQHTSDGSMKWLQTSKIPLHDIDGNVIGVLGTYEDISERKQAEEQLKIAKDTALKANQAKSEFLANMSHELRTPMHGILSFSNLGMSRLETASKDKLGKYFQRINESGSRLLFLINDLLDLSKLEAGKMNFKFVESDIVEVIRSCVEEQKARLDAMHLKVTIDYDTAMTAVCDTIRIGQVITNLLSNAIKFSPEKSVIQIKIKPKSLTLPEDKIVKGLELSVADNGTGIPDNELENIFDKFIQSSKTKANTGGTGLGLSICQEIIKGHQGKLWAENIVGGGSIFNFIIPVEGR